MTTLDKHTFEHDGVTVEFMPSTVRTLLEKRRILRALIEAHGWQDEDIMIGPWEEFENFATAMAQSRADAPWWANSMATPERIREAFECFMEQPPSLLNQFLKASTIVSTPKKTTPNT
jgi:hypothetical protein